MRRRVFSLLVVPFFLGLGYARADAWPQWLGPKRDGVWREDGVVERFPAAGLQLRWSAPLGGGYSGPAVAAGRVFVMDRVVESDVADKGVLIDDGAKPLNENFQRRRLAGKERVVCLDEASGERLWEYEYDCPYTMVSRYAHGPRTTPTVVGNRVYTLGAEGHLHCLQASNGKVLWKQELRQNYGVRTPLWGFASHPLVEGDLVYCMAGGDDTTVVALHRETGQEAWTALSAQEPGYAPAMIGAFGTTKQLVVWHSDAVCGLDLITGALHWSVAAPSTFAMSIGLPVATEGQLLLTSFNRRTWLVRVSQDGDDAEVVWYAEGRRGIGGVMNTPQLDGGYAYGCGPDGRYVCARLADGEPIWTTFKPSTGNRPVQWGNVFTIRHQDRFFLANDFGELVIAKMTPHGYEEVSRAKLIEPDQDIGGRKVVWSHPAFANRSVYLRNDREIRCYSLAADGQESR